MVVFLSSLRACAMSLSNVAFAVRVASSDGFASLEAFDALSNAVWHLFFASVNGFSLTSRPILLVSVRVRFVALSALAASRSDSFSDSPVRSECMSLPFESIRRRRESVSSVSFNLIWSACLIVVLALPVHVDSWLMEVCNRSADACCLTVAEWEPMSANRTSRRMNARAMDMPRRTQTIILASSDGALSGSATSCRLTVVLMSSVPVSVFAGGMSDGVSSPTGIMEARMSSASSGTLASSMDGRGGSGTAGMGRASLDGMEDSGRSAVWSFSTPVDCGTGIVSVVSVGGAVVVPCLSSCWTGSISCFRLERRFFGLRGGVDGFVS